MIIRYLLIKVTFLICIITSSSFAQNDPNRDTNWDWTDQNEQTMYIEYRDVDSGEPIRRKLPLYMEGPACSILKRMDAKARKMSKEDGWVLVHRDFGTNHRPQKVPRYVLYNKYQGILRLFFYCTEYALQDTYNHAIVKLKPNKKIALLSFIEKDKAFIDEFNEDTEQTAICDIEIAKWSFVDFNIIGYDPKIEQDMDAIFEFKVYGVDIGMIELEGEMVSKQEQMISKGQEDGNYNILTHGGDAFEAAAKKYNSFEGFTKKVNEFKDKNKDKWYGEMLQKISDGGLLEAVPYIGAGIGLLNFFLGSEKSNITTTSFDMNIRGKINFENLITYIQFAIPGSQCSGDLNELMLPIYNVPLGVFNLKSRPVVEYFVRPSPLPFLRFDSPYRYHSSIRGKDIQIITNPDLNIKVTAEFGYVFPDIKTTYRDLRDYANYARNFGAVSHISIRAGHSSQFISSYPFIYIKSFLDANVRLALKIKIEPHESHPSPFPPVYIIKAYNPTFIEKGIFYDYQRRYTWRENINKEQYNANEDTLLADKIVLKPGFKVGNGNRFGAYIASRIFPNIGQIHNYKHTTINRHSYVYWEYE